MNNANKVPLIMDNKYVDFLVWASMNAGIGAYIGHLFWL